MISTYKNLKIKMETISNFLKIPHICLSLRHYYYLILTHFKTSSKIRQSAVSGVYHTLHMGQRGIMPLPHQSEKRKKGKAGCHADAVGYKSRMPR